jgi:hypothetical protein
MVPLIFDPATGKKMYSAKQHSPELYYSLPMAGYIPDEELQRHNKGWRTFELLAEIPMKEICIIFSAITDGMIFLGTRNKCNNGKNEPFSATLPCVIY